MTSPYENIAQKYETALELLQEKLQEDRNILAAILFGSLSYDTVWEKSDIDLMLVSRDGKSPANLNKGEHSFYLTEADVNIHALFHSRSEFKSIIEGSLRSSFIHSSFSKSRLLFTRDESIRELYDQVHVMGSKDRQIQLMMAGGSVLPAFYKAEKFLYIKNDPQYSFIWLTFMYPGLAKIECYLHGQIAGREVIQQALKLNPGFFSSIYTQLVDQPKTTKRVGEALKMIDSYLVQKIPLLFQPVLDFLAEGSTIKSATEIQHWGSHQIHAPWAVMICEWLADKGIIDQTSSPIRLTTKSLVEMEEMAFYYSIE